jgi:hypothetical protein
VGSSSPCSTRLGWDLGVWGLLFLCFARSLRLVLTWTCCSRTLERAAWNKNAAKIEAATTTSVSRLIERENPDKTRSVCRWNGLCASLSHFLARVCYCLFYLCLLFLLGASLLHLSLKALSIISIVSLFSPISVLLGASVPWVCQPSQNCRIRTCFPTVADVTMFFL